MTDFKVIDSKGSNTPATTASLAAMEFESVSRVLRNKTQEQRAKNLRNIAQSVYEAASVASALCVRDKAEVVQLVRDNIDLYGPALMELAKAADSAETLLQILRSAEIRLAVALAVVGGEPPPDDGGGEEAAA